MRKDKLWKELLGVSLRRYIYQKTNELLRKGWSYEEIKVAIAGRINGKILVKQSSLSTRGYSIPDLLKSVESAVSAGISEVKANRKAVAEAKEIRVINYELIK